MAQYIGVDGIARTVKKQYVGIEGIARNVKKGYVGVDGVARQFFSGDKTAGDFAVGETLYLTFDGKQTEFIVIHQGNPDTSQYDSSCNGTWLWRPIDHGNDNFDSTDNDYANSDIHALLNGTILNKFSSKVKSAIKQVKIPYWKGTGKTGSLATGSNGLSTKLFLLSLREVGVVSTNSYIPNIGSRLSYFPATDAATTKRVVYYSEGSSSSYAWLTRSPAVGVPASSILIEKDGSFVCTRLSVESARYFAPAFILDSKTLFNPETNTIIT